MTHVLMTHAPEEEERASLVAAHLAQLGYEVRQDAYYGISPFERRKLAADIDKAACVVVLWSREAAETPSLRAAAERAKASGKLALARLDAAAIPAGLTGAVNLSNWIGRAETRAWRQLVKAVGASAKGKAASKSAPRPTAAPARAASATPEPEAKKKGGGVGLAIAALLLLAAAGAGAYWAMSQGLIAL